MVTIKIAKVNSLLNERPEGMDFETYKALRKEQNLKLHGFRGPDGKYVPGRLDGVLIPAHIYHGHSSRDFQIVIR